MAFFLLLCYAQVMQITVEIPDEFAAQIQARGLTPQTFVQRLISQQSSAVPAQTDRVARLGQLERFFEGMAAQSDKIPLLPDEAFSREGFYSDHD